MRQLAAAASVSTDTIARLERGESLRLNTVAAIRTALEKAGAIFIDANGEGFGVRLRKSSPTAAVDAADID